MEKTKKDGDDIVFMCLAGILSTFALQLANNFLGYTKSKHCRDRYMEWQFQSKL